MHRIVILALLVLAIGGSMARFADRGRPSGGASQAAAASTGTGTTASSSTTGSSSNDSFKYRSVSLQRTRSHFEAGARVNGTGVDFVVDTGASMIALRESDAARVGVRVSPADYRMPIQTANGVGRAAKVMLDRVQLSSIEVRNVEAFVVPDRQLAMNLLGMSFLSRVKFSYDQGRMVIEQ